MKHLDLFSGIGGFALAAEIAGGYETVAFCEKDKYARKVLKKNFPETPIYPDIQQMTGAENGTVGIVTGGYPCQPYSTAGKRGGAKDNRDLWPEMLRIIQAARPRWVIGENVIGHISLGIDRVLFDLEANGYTPQTFSIPACAVGALHKRERVWIVAHADNARQYTGARHGQNKGDEKRDDARRRGEILADAFSKRGRRRDTRREYATNVGKSPGHQGGNRGTMGAWDVEPGVGRVANGVSHRVDRLRKLGNAIVPQVAAKILKAIATIEAGE